MDGNSNNITTSDTIEKDSLTKVRKVDESSHK